jgi:hypothetical protein
MIRALPCPAALAFLLAPVAALAEAEPEEWLYLDNGRLRLGVNRSAGAAIGWLSESGRDANVLNRFDLGRYVQQSWYGDRDGSDWNGQPWRWNPVQAGSWRNRPAKVLAFSADPTRIEATTVPVHWASGELLEEVVLEQRVELLGDLVRIEFGMRYDGDLSHPVQDQELPAVFVDAAYPNLHFVAPGETEPRSLVPGWPNERYSLAQPWVAYTDASGRGLGVLVPGVDTITCYRAAGDPNNRDKAACSYVAPVKQMAIVPGFSFRYTVLLTLGTLPEIRHRFAEEMKEAKATEP